MRTSKRASEIMTTPVRTINIDATLHDVARLLQEHGISGAPVVDSAGSLVGVISESDLLDGSKRNAAIPRTALFGLIAVPDELFQRAYEEGWKLSAADVMTRPAIAADEETSLEELVDRMGRHRINRIPIVRGNQVVGIVTRQDLLRALAQPDGSPSK